MDATPRAHTETTPRAARALVRWSCALSALVLLLAYIDPSASAQEGQSRQESNAFSQLNPVQQEIERQRQRLGSVEAEERRDAVMRLGWMSRADSSRVA